MTSALEQPHVRRLTEHALVVEHRLRLEHTVGDAAIDEHSRTQAVDLRVHDLRDQPLLCHRRQRRAESAQFGVLTRQRFVAHGSQFQVTQAGAQVAVLSAQRCRATRTGRATSVNAVDGELTASCKG